MTNDVKAANNETPLTAASSYLSYLPACYAEADASGAPPFVALYLKIFEKLLSGIADGDELDKAKLDEVIAYRAGVRELLNANVIGNLFYPRWSFLFAGDAFTDAAKSFTPPLSEATSADKKALFNILAAYVGLPQYAEGTNKALSPIERWARGFLEWLGSTIGLTIDKKWAIDASREMIAKTFAYDRARGTPMGLEWWLNAFIAANPLLADGATGVQLTVHDCMRPALIVCDTDDGNEPPVFYLRDFYSDPKTAVVISDVVGPKVNRDGITIDSVDDKPLYAYVPRRFEIEITLSGVAQGAEDSVAEAYYRAVQSALAEMTPALTTYVVHIGFEGTGSKLTYSLWRPLHGRSKR